MRREIEAVRHIPGFPGYFISDAGVVYSEKFCSRFPRCGRRRVAVSKDRFGYELVYLSRKGKSYPRRIHRLVLEAFVGPRPMGMECLHGVGGKSDNHIENLRWGTRSENIQDKVRDGTTNRGSAAWNSKLTEWNVRIIRLMTGRYPVKRIAAIFDVSPNTVCAINTKRNWYWLK